MLPSTVHRIRGGAFRALASLVSLDIGSTAITRLESRALHGLSQMTSIDLPDTLGFMEENAFGPLSSLESLDLSSTAMEVLGVGAFSGLRGDFLTSVSLPLGLTEVQGGAFRNSTGLGGIDFMDTQLHTLRSGAFDGIASWRGERLALPPTVTVIEGDSLGTADIATISLENTQVTELLPRVFAGPKLPDTINLPTALRRIHPGAMDGIRSSGEL